MQRHVAMYEGNGISHSIVVKSRVNSQTSQLSTCMYICIEHALLSTCNTMYACT